MLGCFLIGLIWIVVYYVTGQDLDLPVIGDLGNYNLLVGHRLHGDGVRLRDPLGVSRVLPSCGHTWGQ